MGCWLRVSVWLLFCLFLAGCWNRVELNELGVISVTGLDWEDGEWVVTFQQLVPAAMGSASGGGVGGSSQSSIHVFTTHAKTFQEAITLGHLENTRQLHFAHNNLVVIGSSAAKHGIKEIIEYFWRSVDYRETAQLLVAERNARTILQMYMSPEKLPGISLTSLVNEESRETSMFPTMNVFEAALHLGSEAKAIGIPEVKITGSPSEDQKSMEANKKTSSSSKIVLSRLAVFRGDRLVGHLDKEESLGVSWLANEVKHATYSIPCPNKDGYFAYRVLSSDVRITTIKNRGQLNVFVKARAFGSLQQNGCFLDLSQNANIEIMEKAIAHTIRENILNGWNAMRELHVDLAGLADRIHRYTPQLWRELKRGWNEQLETSEINITVAASISSQGNSFGGIPLNIP